MTAMIQLTANDFKTVIINIAKDLKKSRHNYERNRL